jgi:ribosomal protein S18 acetylase RimI-like enzyme
MKIRQMKYSDIGFALQCTRLEGWVGETKEVFDTFLKYNSKGCFIAEQNSKRIGICSATMYKTNGFIGVLIIIKEMRQQGYGKKLLYHSIKYLKTQGAKNIYLDGDLDAIPIYEKFGFKKICKSLRFVGNIKGKKNKIVRRVRSSDIDKICTIDFKLFGDDRSFFLKHLITQFPNLCFVIDDHDEILGYILARPGIGVITVGPWAVVNSVNEPAILLENLACEVEEKRLRIGVLETNTKSLKVIKLYPSLEEKAFCWRMVLGSSIDLGINNNLFCIGSGAKG